MPCTTRMTFTRDELALLAYTIGETRPKADPEDQDGLSSLAGRVGEAMLVAMVPHECPGEHT